MPPHQFSNSHIITILRIMGTLAEFMICSWLVAIYNLSTVTQVFSSLWMHQWTFPYSWCGDSFDGELSCTSQVELFYANGSLCFASAGPRPVVSSAFFSWPLNSCCFSLFPYFQKNNSIDKLGKVKYRMASENGISDKNYDMCPRYYTELLILEDIYQRCKFTWTSCILFVNL